MINHYLMIAVGTLDKTLDSLVKKVENDKTEKGELQ
jgi:hypothetical protein